MFVQITSIWKLSSSKTVEAPLSSVMTTERESKPTGSTDDVNDALVETLSSVGIAPL